MAYSANKKTSEIKYLNRRGKMPFGEEFLGQNQPNVVQINMCK